MDSYFILAIICTIIDARPQDGSHPTVTSQDTCVDVLSICSLLDLNFYCTGEFREWAYYNCRLSCNICNETFETTPSTTTPSTTTPPSTSPTPACEYGGRRYGQGEYWTDGCKYNCSCEDVSIGYYRCRDLCPVYSALPPDCYLIDVPGECCYVPDCGFENVSTIKPMLLVS